MYEYAEASSNAVESIDMNGMNGIVHADCIL